MKNLFPVYKCDDYRIDKGILLIENPELLGMVQDKDQFQKLVSEEIYKVDNELYFEVICPAILQDEFDTFEYVKFIY